MKMRKKDKLYFIRFILRTAMYVHPIDQSTIVSFVDGYESGADGKCALTKLLRKHFSEKLSIVCSTPGWSGQIREYSEKKGLTWVTVFKQECIEAFASDGNGLDQEMQKQIRRSILCIIQRIDEQGLNPWFNDWLLNEWNTICLIKRKWFKDLWTASELKALKAISREINENDAFKNSQPLKATDNLLKQKTKFAL